MSNFISGKSYKVSHTSGSSLFTDIYLQVTVTNDVRSKGKCMAINHCMPFKNPKGEGPLTCSVKCCNMP